MKHAHEDPATIAKSSTDLAEELDDKQEIFDTGHSRG